MGVHLYVMVMHLLGKPIPGRKVDFHLSKLDTLIGVRISGMALNVYLLEIP